MVVSRAVVTRPKDSRRARYRVRSANFALKLKLCDDEQVLRNLRCESKADMSPGAPSGELLQRREQVDQVAVRIFYDGITLSPKGVPRRFFDSKSCRLDAGRN